MKGNTKGKDRKICHKRFRLIAYQNRNIDGDERGKKFGGVTDWRSPAAKVLTFALKSQSLGVINELVIYTEDDDAASLNHADGNRPDGNRRVVERFKRHLK